MRSVAAGACLRARLRTLVFMTGATMLAACASTPDTLRSDPERKRVQIIQVNYQLALKRIVQWHGECVPGPLLPIGTPINDVLHLPELREASFIVGASGIGKQIMEITDLKGIGAETTEMTTYTGSRVADRFARKQRLIAEGESRCPSFWTGQFPPEPAAADVQ